MPKRTKTKPKQHPLALVGEMMVVVSAICEAHREIAQANERLYALLPRLNAICEKLKETK